MKLFRHKLVHLAQPKPVVKHDDQRVSWQYWHDNRGNHLRLEKLSKKEPIDITPSCRIEFDGVFHISIVHLAKDVADSVNKPNGYMASLETTVDLQDRFEQAISQMYDIK